MELNETQMKNRILWVRALLSADYQQGRRALKVLNEDGSLSYCCLGVACEIVAPESQELNLYKPINTDRLRSAPLMSPETSMSYFGLSAEDQSTAAHWNDYDGYGFERIADFVAFATQHGLGFSEIKIDTVPDKYAEGWLILRQLT